VVVVVVVVVSAESADSSEESMSAMTLFPAPAESAAPEKKSVANARLTAIRRGMTRILRVRALEALSTLLRSRRTTALRSDSAAVRKSRWKKRFPGRGVRCGIALLHFVRAPRPPHQRGSEDIRRRNGIETTIGVGWPNRSLDLGNCPEDHYSEGLPGNALGAMNGIDHSPSGGAATPKTLYRRLSRRDRTFHPKHYELYP